MIAPETIVSFYKFTPIAEPHDLKKSLKSLCLNLKLQGTIIIAGEGINGMVAGPGEGIESLMAFLKADSRFQDVVFKLSYHQGSSFRRMLVKVKKQCITLRETVDPCKESGARLSPQELKQWFDEGKEMILVDTRNDYEVAIGTFKGAIDPKLKCFDEFPQWLTSNLNEAKDRPIVTFCTGGIRCEKATAYMLQQGFREVYQLDGGIISYLEQTKDLAEDNHWEGECVVFDKRIAIDKELNPSRHQHCFVCLTRLSAKNIAATPYPAGQACAPCAAHMDSHQHQRVQKGLSAHEENLRQRRDFIASQREKFKV
jgi:UPF0176 protein